MSEFVESLTSEENSWDIPALLQKMIEEKHSSQIDNIDRIKTIDVAFSILRNTNSEDAYKKIYDGIVNKTIVGDADEYHNVAVVYAKNNQPEFAVHICKIGLELWPKDVDLNADTLTYMLDAGDFESAKEQATRLSKNCPDRSKWSWRGFSFLFDYYTIVKPAKYEEEVEQLVKDYKKYLPQEERAYLCDADWKESRGQLDKMMEGLESAISKLNAPQCALKLADAYFEKGAYEDVVRVATLGVAYAAEPQPSIRTAYLLFLRALSKDALYLKSGETSANTVKQILSEYNLAKKYVSRAEKEVIDLRIDILKTYAALENWEK